MSNIAIQVEALGKLYQIGQRQQYRTLKDTLTHMLTGSLRHLNSIGRPVNQRLGREKIWALKEVNFEIKHGEVVGIIGRNGAGKSTLLKILSRITKPTIGWARTRGRVGSLLEVGTGFHPELTGRENIYLNGAILGMRRVEIRRKFDEIVSFAEVEKYIDTPVKHYSSGMYMRLAFAVAANLEPEILIVDEVLAVGDVAFQKKCLGKMGSVAKEGRTVLFVSHNMDAIQQMCSRCFMFEHGQLIAHGETDRIIAAYLSSYSYRTRPNETIDLSNLKRIGTGEALFTAVSYNNPDQEGDSHPSSNGPVEFLFTITSDAPRSVGSLAVFLSSQLGTKLINADTVMLGRVVKLRQGHNLIKLRIDKLYLNPGVYQVGLWLADPISSRTNTPYDYIESAFEIEVFKPEAEMGFSPHGFVPCRFDVTELD